MLPRVSWTLAGQPVDMADWNASVSRGGFDKFSGTMPAGQFARVPGAMQGSTLRATGEDGLTIWEGRVSALPQVAGGLARVGGEGPKIKAEKTTDRLFLQSRDMSQWVSSDSDPHINDNHRPVYEHQKKYDLIGTKGRIGVTVKDLSTYKDDGTLQTDRRFDSGDRSGYIFYAEGVDLGRVAFTILKGSSTENDHTRDDDDANFEIQLRNANGPTGSESGSLVTYSMSGANPTGTDKDYTFASPKDLILLYWNCNTNNTTPGTVNKWYASRIRVNSDIVPADQFLSSQVFKYVASQMGWDARGVMTAPTNILPFDWDGDWASGLDYLEELEDWFWRVSEDRGSGPYMEFAPWGTTKWTAYAEEGAELDLEPLELFNRVVVHYQTSAGISRRAVATPTVDPLAGTGITNTYEYSLEDAQGDENDLAPTVAQTLANRYATQRYRGRVNIVTAYDSAGRANPYGIRYGDTITIADWDPFGGMSQELRVTEAEYTQDAVTLGIEQPINEANLIADIADSAPRGPRTGRRHKKHHGHKHH